MANVLTNGKVKIGAYRFHDRKHLALCVAEGNSIVVCGYFNNDDNADFFMNKLAELIGLREDEHTLDVLHEGR